MVESEHNPSHVMLWSGMTATHLIDPHFHDGPVNKAFSAEILEASLLLQLRDGRLVKDVRLQRDRACTFCLHHAQHFE
jgi:hypothetical protein